MNNNNFFFSVFAVIMLTFVLNSCSSNKAPHIWNVSKYIISEEDKKFQIDSFKVINVVDNRKVKDSIIGTINDDNRLLIIDRPLPVFLKMMFNTLICKDSTQTSIIPVTVSVDEFSSVVLKNIWGDYQYYKYNYLFEYPYGKENRKFRIIDSLTTFSTDLYDQKKLIRDGIRLASQLFIWNTNVLKYIDSMKIARPDTIINFDNKDTLDFSPYRKRKYGWMLNLYKGLKTKSDFSISWEELRRFPDSQWEQGLGFGLQYIFVNNDERKGGMLGILIPYFNKYYPYKNSNFIYFNGVYSLVLGLENNHISEGRFFMGLRLEETIGFNLLDYLSVDVGFYQQGYLLSRLLPYDAGITLSVYFNSGY